MNNRYESSALTPTVHVSLAALFLAGCGSAAAMPIQSQAPSVLMSGAVYENDAVRAARYASNSLQQPPQKIVSDHEFVAAATTFYKSLSESQTVLDADVALLVHDKLWDMYCD